MVAEKDFNIVMLVSVPIVEAIAIKLGTAFCPNSSTMDCLSSNRGSNCYKIYNQRRPDL